MFIALNHHLSALQRSAMYSSYAYIPLLTERNN